MSRSYSRKLIKTASASDAALAQASGRRSFRSLKAGLSQSTITDSTTRPSTPIEQDPAEIARQAIEQEKARLKKVQAEIQAYKDAGLMDLGDDEDLQAVDLLQFWKVCTKVSK